MDKKPDYSNMPKLIEWYSKQNKDNFDFSMLLSERMEYFSDRWGKEHIKCFDLLWKELKKRLKKEKRNTILSSLLTDKQIKERDINVK